VTLAWIHSVHKEQNGMYNITNKLTKITNSVLYKHGNGIGYKQHNELNQWASQQVSGDSSKRFWWTIERCRWNWSDV